MQKNNLIFWNEQSSFYKDYILVSEPKWRDSFPKDWILGTTSEEIWWSENQGSTKFFVVVEKFYSLSIEPFLTGLYNRW